MISRCLEKKVELIPDEELVEMKNSIELEYYLVESEISDLDELKGEKVYGIEIVKKAIDMPVERQVVRNLSCCRESARSMLDKLAYNTVTPVELPFILDDIIGT